MTLRIPAKVLLHVWSYDFYDMTLSTGKQRRHMINIFMISVLLCKRARFQSLSKLVNVESDSYIFVDHYIILL